MFVKYENKVREAYQACWTVISNVGTAQTTVTGFLVEGTHNKLKASPDLERPMGDTMGRRTSLEQSQEISFTNLIINMEMRVM